MRILIFDNYDSFTYNLVHIIEKLIHDKVDVYLNDQLPLEKARQYDKIILSPGPGIPEEAGLLLPLIREYATTKPILGVCLGHQAIATSFGGCLINLDKVFHGLATPVSLVKKDYIFKHIDDKFDAGRYHSWVVSDKHFPAELEVTARDDNGYIMALAHKTYDIRGVQFHPESVLTPHGEKMLSNWIKE
jgi:anthranilate synthase component 2